MLATVAEVAQQPLYNCSLEPFVTVGKQGGVSVAEPAPESSTLLTVGSAVFLKVCEEQIVEWFRLMSHLKTERDDNGRASSKYTFQNNEAEVFALVWTVSSVNNPHSEANQHDRTQQKECLLLV